MQFYSGLADFPQKRSIFWGSKRMYTAKTFLGDRKELFPMKRMITRRNQKIITIIVALVLLLNCSTFSSAKQVEPTKGQWEDKIEEDLREAMEAASDDEYIPVWIWRKDIDQSELNSLILERTGFDPEIYEDITLFNERILPEIEEEVRKNHGRNDGPIRRATNLAIEKNDPERIEERLVKKATLDKINEYNHQKRIVAREEYSKNNKEFLEKALPKRNDRKTILCSPYTPSIIVEVTKPEIELLAQDDTVESLSLFVDHVCEAAMCDVLSQVGVYCDGGTGYAQAGLWPALTGYGVIIGVLEAPSNSGTDGGKFDENAPQLVGNTNLHFIENYRSDGSHVSSTVTQHATNVVSMIAGQSVVYNGQTYRGVVPDATIYQTPVYLLSDIISGIYACLNYDVSILNLSLGGDDSDEPYYSCYEKEIDQIIRDYHVVVVASAGNTGYNTAKIQTPGRAQNAITVGCAMTKIYAHFVLSAPFSVSGFSSYLEESYCTNKPDLVAPGWAYFLKYETNNQGTQLTDTLDMGTSYSAPIVTGIAAQIVENNPYYLHEPMQIKAALLAGAELSQINTSTDTATTAFVYDKCGAGMVNAINSVANVNYDFLGEVSSSTSTGNYYYWNAGDRVRAVLTFAKNNNSSITSTSDRDDLDLILVKQNNFGADYLVSNSLSYTNNNEIIDVTLPEDGVYYFIVYVRSIKDYLLPPTACVAFEHFS